MKNVEYTLCDRCCFCPLPEVEKEVKLCPFFIPFEEIGKGKKYSPRMLRKYEDAGGDVLDLLFKDDRGVYEALTAIL